MKERCSREERKGDGERARPDDGVFVSTSGVRSTPQPRVEGSRGRRKVTAQVRRDLLSRRTQKQREKSRNVVKQPNALQ